MNETIKELTERKSVRAYTDEPVDPQKKSVIIQAAMEAPTAGNQQLYGAGPRAPAGGREGRREGGGPV